VVGTSGVAIWAEGIKADLKQRLPGQRKTQRDKLSLLVATMLHVRSANLVELASGLPRRSDRWDMGYQWIARFLANDLARIIHRTARNRPRPPNTWARNFIAKNFIKQPIRIVVSDINGLALIAHFS